MSPWVGTTMDRKRNRRAVEAAVAPRTERPILFCTSLVPEILADRKTVTRRIVTHPKRRTQLPFCFPHPGGGWIFADADVCVPYGKHGKLCPYGATGDRLWVRETFMPRFINEAVDAPINRAATPRYRADEGEDRPEWRGLWKPSIHMPRWASRITLEVVSVRVERLQDITAEDVQAEGIKLPATDHGCPPGKVTPLVRIGSPYLTTHPDARHWTEEDFWRSQFACTWDDINAKRAPWSSNPWVWRIEFRRVQG